MTIKRNSNETRGRLLDAARDIIRSKGYAATTVDDICHAAGVTKGGFFHHFPSKDQLGIEAAQQFGEMAEGIFSTAPYTALPDPRDRVLGYIDFRASMLDAEISQYTCLLGTMVQEAYATHPHVRDACNEQMTAHVDEITRDIEAARLLYAPDAAWTAESLGYYIQSVLQGGFIYAKAKQSPEIALSSLKHLKNHVSTLLPLQPRELK